MRHVDQEGYFPGCADTNCDIESGHHHGDQFRTWRQSLTDAQRDELGQLANQYQKSLSWVAANVGISA